MASQTNTTLTRPDSDIFNDIQQLLTSTTYAPLMHDRHKLEFTVKDGVVEVRGHVKVPTTRRFLLAQLPRVRGVHSVKADEFYDDETIRLEAGRKTGGSVQIVVDYGTVILAGKLPDSLSAEYLVEQVRAVPGVKRVITTF